MLMSELCDIQKAIGRLRLAGERHKKNKRQINEVRVWCKRVLRLAIDNKSLRTLLNRNVYAIVSKARKVVGDLDIAYTLTINRR